MSDKSDFDICLELLQLIEEQANLIQLQSSTIEALTLKNQEQEALITELLQPKQE